MVKLDLTIMFFVVFRADYRMRLFRMNLTEMNMGPWQIGLGTQFKELKAEGKENRRAVRRDDLNVCVMKKQREEKMAEVLNS